MSSAPPTYDLVLMLDPQADDAARAKVLADARAAIEAQGELVRHDEWGNRTLTYPIGHRAVAEYHLMQFHASSAGLLAALNRSLRIADEALRFRIIKLRSGVPDAPDMRSSAEPASTSRSAAVEQEPAPAAPATAQAAGQDAPREASETQGQGESAPEPSAAASDQDESQAPSGQSADAEDAASS